MYRNICRSYDDAKVNRKGEDLFIDHFEANGDGIIMFVKPPQKRYSSLEVYCFLVSIMQNQHMRILYEQNKMLIKETTIKVKEVMSELDQLKSKVEALISDADKKVSVESSVPVIPST